MTCISMVFLAQMVFPDFLIRAPKVVEQRLVQYLSPKQGMTLATMGFGWSLRIPHIRENHDLLTVATHELGAVDRRVQGLVPHRLNSVLLSCTGLGHIQEPEALPTGLGNW